MSDGPAYLESMTSPQLMTADELLRSQPRDKRSELIRGRLIVREPAGARHGLVAAEIARRMGNHTHDTGLGYTYAAETGFKIETDPDTVRAPDVAFVSRERTTAPGPEGFFDIAPDLAVEVLSHDDRPGAVLAKVGDWINAGCRLVWVVDTEKRVGRIYRADGSESLLDRDGVLDGEDVLPGLSIPIAELF
jgi:Uma2 family endonuclease